LAYQYLAQLSIDDAWQALKLYEASIELLHSQLKGKDRATATQEENGADDEERETRSSIVKALVGMVEIWMDPQHELWLVYFIELGVGLTSHSHSDLPEAEQTCQDLLEKAKQVDPENVEALQMLASVRMSQSRPDEARQCLETAWAQWKDLEIGMFSISVNCIVLIRN
jgi:tetratricopeptide (TPR) repeat protein